MLFLPYERSCNYHPDEKVESEYKRIVCREPFTDYTVSYREGETRKPEM